MNRIGCVAFGAVLVALGVRGERVKPPEYIGAPVGPRAVDQRAFTGISSLAVAANGRLWATWYAGPTPAEDANNYVVLSTSADDGKTWQELFVVDPDGEGPRRTYDPEVWISPDGQLLWLWADRTGGDQQTVGTWAMSFPNALEVPAKPETPRCIAHGVTMCKPIVLKDGTWALPSCEWFTDRSSGMTVSTDQGRTWTFRGGASMVKEDREFDEHNFVQLKNGDVRVYSRAKSGPRTALSHDGGVTWSTLEPTKSFRNTNTRFFVRRLKSGNLLLVKNGPRDQNVGRKQLTAFLSRDEGATWEGGLLLEERNSATYPDGDQRADGLIYITYDYDRTNARTIYFCTFTEADVLAGKPVSGQVRLREVVSKGTGAPRLAAVDDNKDGVLLLKGAVGAFAEESYTADVLKADALLFTDRRYRVAPEQLPNCLDGMQFLRIPLMGEQELTVAKAGVVGVLSPLPNRNGDSCKVLLERQGFRRVALPEVRLFDPQNRGNFVSLWQKVCTAGEKVRVGKWGVPVWQSKAHEKTCGR